MARLTFPSGIGRPGKAEFPGEALMPMAPMAPALSVMDYNLENTGFDGSTKPLVKSTPASDPSDSPLMRALMRGMLKNDR